MLERYLIRHCSPTLASIKTANLFNIRFENGKQLGEQIGGWNACLNDKGVTLTVLRRSEKSALIYVYRRSRLQRELMQPAAAEFLEKYGYTVRSAEKAVQRLKERLAETGSFPHEIGIFLGYPLSDVIGFIENGGNNCKCADCWKVYGDEKEAKKTFAKLKKCQRMYFYLWKCGSSVLQLTVAA